MKCPKIVPAMLHNGEVKRPERPCPEIMQQLEENLWTCPFHGLVETDPDLEKAEEEWREFSQLMPNGKIQKRGWFRRG